MPGTELPEHLPRPWVKSSTTETKQKTKHQPGVPDLGGAGKKDQKFKVIFGDLASLRPVRDLDSKTKQNKKLKLLI